VLFRERDPAASAIVILSGLVKIQKLARDGDELILSLCGPGDLLGEVTAVQGATRSADAIALEAVEVAAVAVADWRALLAHNSRLALVLLERRSGVSGSPTSAGSSLPPPRACRG
jgi:CRP-like cAMP-binding protein